MLEQTLAGLLVRPDGVLVDGTYGRGGHSAAILEHLGAQGRLHALDRDPAACADAFRRFAAEPRFRIHHRNFAELAAWAEQEGLRGQVDGLLLDLGVSSPQLDDATRGFSFAADGPLDMRMDPGAGESAADWLARADEVEIADVLWRYGDERNSRRIARRIVERRTAQPLTTTRALAELVAAVPGPRSRRIHPATRSFQAIRIHINGEMQALESALRAAPLLLAPGGRLAVISFHSLEDRMVKRFMRDAAAGDAPVLRRVAREFPDEAEIGVNPGRAAPCCAWRSAAHERARLDRSPRQPAAADAGAAGHRQRRGGGGGQAACARPDLAAGAVASPRRRARPRAGPASARGRHALQPRADRRAGAEAGHGRAQALRHRRGRSVSRSAAHTTQPQPTRVWRRWLVMSVLVLGAGVVVVRAAWLQVVENGFLSGQGDKRFIRTETLQAHRGAILDRRGSPLALSAPVDSIWVVPADLLAAPRYLPALATLLHTNEAGLKKFLAARKSRKFVYLKRQMAPAEARRFMALDAPGLFSQREYRRYYPAGAVLAQVVGFCGLNDHGQAGIELTENQDLAGHDGERRVIRDRTGHVVQDTRDYVPAKPGKDVRLTIDMRLQYVAYRELARQVQAQDARAGLVVIANARNGHILAMASVPSFNPNRDSDRDSPGIRNRAIADVFEPGSTIKPLLISQALTHHVIKTSTRIDTDGGVFKVGALTVHDVEDNGIVDIATLLSHSSNIGAAKVGLRMGPQLVWQGYRNFGLDQLVDVALPGQGQSILRPWTDWGDIATATASYGYGVAVNALQMLRAYAAIADNGLMPKLSIVEGGQPVPPQRVVPASVASEVRTMLEGVVSNDGTAVRAAVPGYRVAGKTGTARMTENGSYVPGDYRALFVGMLPAAHPQLVGIVVIDDPKHSIYGGMVSAPVFSNIMQAAVRLFQVAPDQPLPPPTQTAAAGGHPGAPS
jgi:S-adenosyl-methyltransferase MraW